MHESVPDRETIATDRLRYELAMERARIALVRALRPDERQTCDAQIADIDHRIAALPGRRIERLSRRLGLDANDVLLLWTALAVGHDPTCGAHAAVICGSDYAGGLTLALHVLAHQFDPGHARRLALRLNDAHPLILQQLLIRRGDIPGKRTFHVPDRVAGYLAGSDDIDPGLIGLASILRRRDDIVLDVEHGATLDTLAQLLTDEPEALIVLEGPNGVGRRTIIANAADDARRVAVCVDAARLEPGAATEMALAALRREVLLRERAVAVLANLDQIISEEAGSVRLRSITRLVDQIRGPAIITTAVAGMEFPSTRTLIRLRLPPPSVEVRAEIWRRQFVDTDLDVHSIALRYRLGPGDIDAAGRAAAALGRVRGGTAPVMRDVIDGVRAVIAERLGRLAMRVETHEAWTDLVLQQDTLDQIRALIGRVRHAHQVLDTWGMRGKLARGTGVAALFSGPPGTGKTMVAGIIARELDLELYQVDLSKVVSKWVGETEKQLAQIFDAAEAGHALLLFDEADALFAKRTEVRAAVDRYANLEVNYLLQRVEAFGGVTILTTNMDTSIDPALKRRLAGHVVFWPPDEDERALLWSKMLSDSVPRDGTLDFAALAADYPDMTGANIRNAALAATFLAAAEGVAVRHDHLQRAAHAEYRAMGRVLGKRGVE